MTNRDSYDWRVDSFLSWQLALAEIRKRKIEFDNMLPLNNEERSLATRGGR